MTRPGPNRSPFRSLARAASWHRRKLAVVAAIAAVLSAISAARPPGPPTEAVVRAVRSMPAGTVLTETDVRLDRVPTATVPDEVLADSRAVLGKSLAGPVPKGQMLTTLSLLSLRSQAIGAVVSPIRLADAQVVGLLAVGERIDVIVTGSQGERARTVATDVPVVGLPKLPAASGLGEGDGSGDALVLVEVDPRTATLLADAAAGGRLSVALH